MSRFKIGIGLGISALALGLAGGVATSASASTAGNPTPPPTRPPHVRPVTTPWQFDVQQSDIGRAPGLNITVNNVDSGPTGIIMRNWTDVNGPNPFIDTFRRGPNSVTLFHSPIGLATFDVNLRTCTLALDQTGQFRIINGTGTGARFTSRGGQFRLNGMLSWDLNRRGVCPLVFVSHRQLVRFVQNNANVGLPAPSFTDINVQGRADLTRTPVVRPFAPSVSPSDSPSDTASPTDTPSA